MNQRRWKSPFVTREELDERLETLEERMENMEASQAQNQSQIDAETAKVDATEVKLVAIQAAVDALKNAQQNGQTLDFTNLDKALAGEDVQADTDLADASTLGGPPPPAPAA